MNEPNDSRAAVAYRATRERPGSSSSSEASRQGIGRLLIAVTLALLGVVAVHLTVTGFAGVDPDDPGMYDVATFVSPILAVAAALVTGLLLVILAWLRMIELSAGRALGALLLATVGGPIAYLILLVGAGLGLNCWPKWHCLCAPESVDKYVAIPTALPQTPRTTLWPQGGA